MKRLAPNRAEILNQYGHGMPRVSPIRGGAAIYSRDKVSKGIFTGGTRPCQLEGCGGNCLRVQWSDGKCTYPCAEGLVRFRRGWRLR